MCSIRENKESSHNMSHGINISKEKEDDCKIIVIKFVNIRFSELETLSSLGG